MRGELEAPADLGGRFARACPIHKRLLDDGLECPMGHHVEQWATYDRQKAVFMFEGVEADKPEILDAPRGLPAAGRPRAIVDRPKPAKENDVAASSTKLKKKLVLSERLEDGAKAVLYVQLISLFGGDPRTQLDRWRISWRHVGANKAVVVGIAATAVDEVKARAAYDQVVSGAAKAGWQKIAASRGYGRAIILRPVPAPAKATARAV